MKPSDMLSVRSRPALDDGQSRLSVVSGPPVILQNTKEGVGIGVDKRDGTKALRMGLSAVGEVVFGAQESINK